MSAKSHRDTLKLLLTRTHASVIKYPNNVKYTQREDKKMHQCATCNKKIKSYTYHEGKAYCAPCSDILYNQINPEHPIKVRG